VMRLFMNLAAQGSADPEDQPNPFLADVRVRQAIRKAIDVDAILESVWHGYGTPVWTEFYRPPYQCDLLRPPYDAAGAQALLEEAGWTDQDGDGVRECHGCRYAGDGQPLVLDFNIYSEYGEPLALTQQSIGKMLRQVGIQADLASVPGSVLWADSKHGGLEQLGRFDVDLYDDGYSGIDPAPYLALYYASASAAPDKGWNIGRWKNAQFDALLAQANTLDERQRKEAFCQMAEILDAELPEIPLFATINADVYSTRLDGIQMNINDVVSWNVADWTIDQ
jgi:peptide/nickel transport system substrate-binding protein